MEDEKKLPCNDKYCPYNAAHITDCNMCGDGCVIEKEKEKKDK